MRSRSLKYFAEKKRVTMRSRLPNRSVKFAMFAAILAAGCTNRPNALQLTLSTSKQVYLHDEPIRLTATFSSTEGTVCINKPWVKFLDFELSNLESDEQLEHTPIFFCGTPYVALAPLMPFMYAGAFLDVANVGGRFIVIEENQPQDFSYELLGNGSRFIMRSEAATQNRDDLRHLPLPPGRYRLNVSLESELQRRTIIPLLWALYGQTVSAATEFEVLPAS